jgi:hypothetical protein
MAQKLGTLTAVLRNPTDAKTAGLDPLDETEFKRVAAGPRAGGGVRHADYVEIITGGTGERAQRYRAALEEAPLAALLAAGPRPMAPPSAPAAAPDAFDARARMGISEPASAPRITGFQPVFSQH